MVARMNIVQNVLTAPGFAEETLGLSELDNAIERSGAFRVCREVCGEYLQPRLNAEQKGARIDRILLPNQKAIDAGWLDGPIGIEGKRSGMKIGKVLSQALDYSRCAWEIKNGFCVWLRWVFIWPLENPKADLESVMAQNRIGYVGPAPGSRIVFGCGGTNGITIMPDGSLNCKPLPMGRKVGSR